MLLTVIAGLTIQSAIASQDHPGRAALDYAFKFASAIEADPKDQSRGQQGVVMVYAESGMVNEAVKKADQVVGWRRGAAYADLAALLAREGREDEARSLLEKAESVRQSQTDWHGPRISAHIAQALAVLGDVEPSRQLAGELAAADRQYIGRSVATLALAYGASGDFQEAMGQLAKLDEATDFQEAWWRTTGYLNLARQGGLTAEQRQRAMEAAHRSAKEIPGWGKVDALADVAREYIEMGERQRARDAIQSAEELILAQPATLPVKTPLVVTVADLWAELGDGDRARGLLKTGEEGVAQVMLIEQPGVYGNLAGGYAALGDDKEARRLFDKAVAAARALKNSRPRALAMVSICSTMGRAELALDESMRAALDAVYGSLGDPW
jgi:tetratricopeptide (TPR) repeat protein